MQQQLHQIKLLFLVLFFLFNLSNIHAQNTPNDVPYFDAMKKYYNDLVEDNPDNIEKKIRAEVNLLSKLDENGSLETYSRAMSSVCGDICNTSDNANWNFIGPHVYEDGNIHLNGYVGQVCADPNQVNNSNPALNCLLGTPTSGIWKYDGNKWNNKTDNLGEYGLGITEILRDPTNNDYLLASTGIDHHGDYGTSMGLLYSNNNGNSWVGVSNMYPGFDPCFSNIKGVYQDYNSSGQAISLTNAFYIIADSRTRHGDELWYYCSNTGWQDITPQLYLDYLANTDSHQRLHDFTANSNNSVLVTTSSPYNFGVKVYHAQKLSACPNNTPFHFVDKTQELENTAAGFDETQNQGVTISHSKNNIVYARCHGDDGNTLYKSTSGGVGWTSEAQVIFNGAKLNSEYSPTTGIVYIAQSHLMMWDDVNKILHQTNPPSPHVNIRDFSIAGINSAGKEIVFVANDGGVAMVTYDPALATPDINATGVFTSQPISGTSMPIQQVWGLGLTQSTNPKIAIGMMNNNNCMANIDGDWCKFSAGHGGDTEVNHVDNSTVYFTNSPYIYKGDFNDICGSYGTLVGQTHQWQYSRPIDLHPANQCELYYGNDQRNGTAQALAADLVIYNDCEGTTANKSLSNITGNTSGHYMKEIGAIGLTEANPNVIYLGTNVFHGPLNSGFFVKSTNKGNSWVDLSDSPVSYNGEIKPLNDWIGWSQIGDIIVSPTDKNKIFITQQNVGEGLRMLRSADGGSTFIDWSEGLTALPANIAVYQHNTNDGIFIGTDAGVYYRDNSMSQWVCFSENLPFTLVTDLDINYCENMIYASTHGRGVYKTALNAFPTENTPIEIISDQSWSNVQRVFHSDVIVKAGVTLNIVNSKMKFAARTKIIVEPTGVLNISDSELTALCEDNCWNGLQVEGNTTLPQSSTPGINQGYISLNNSIISHAINAVSIYGYNENNGDADWQQNGGIIQAFNTDFINNRRAIEFLGYENIDGSNPEQPNRSQFINCDFIIDDDYYGLLPCGSNSPFITMWHVNGVKIEGCNFTELRTGLSNASDCRSGFGGGESTPSSRNCTFTNLWRGIDMYEVTADNIFEIEILDAEFYNNETAIRFLDINNESKILRNHIKIGHPLSINSTGILMDNSSGFQMEENICKKAENYPAWSVGYDIVSTINNNNPSSAPYFGHNIVSNNLSEGNDIGFTASGTNVPSANTNTGLEFLCNQNIDNTYVDFSLEDRIKPTQGSLDVAAGNTFTDCNDVVPIQINYTGGLCLTYYRHASEPLCDLDGCISVLVADEVAECACIPPRGSMALLENEICEGESTSLEFSIGGRQGPYTVNYSINGVSTSLAIENNHIETLAPMETTTYILQSVTDPFGCSATINSDPIVLTVHPKPTANAGDDEIICEEESINLNGSNSSTNENGNGNLIYEWSASDENNSTYNGDIIMDIFPTATTTYTLTVTNSDTDCQHTDQVTVTVNPTPTVEAGSNPPPICKGESVMLNGEASIDNGNSLSYDWSPIDGLSSSTSLNPTASPMTTTTYILTVTDNITDCQHTDQVTVTVNPTPTVEAGSNPPPICKGESVMLNGTASIDNGNSLSYHWSPPTGLSSSSILNPEASPTTTTTYTLTVIDDITDCQHTDQVTVTVNAPPTGDIIGCELVCSNDGNTYYYEFDGSAADSYQWTIPSDVTIESGAGTNTIEITFPSGSNPTTIGVVASNQGCEGDLISLDITFDDECVWPGDINYDDTVNVTDFNRFISLYGKTCGLRKVGFSRNNCLNLVNYDWTGRPAKNWGDIPSGCFPPSPPFPATVSWDTKHLDVNGDGMLKDNFTSDYANLNPPPQACSPSPTCPNPLDNISPPETDLDLIYYQFYYDLHSNDTLIHNGNLRNNPPKHVYIEPTYINNDNERIAILLELKIGEAGINEIDNVSGINLEMDFGEGILNNAQFFYENFDASPLVFGTPNFSMLKMNFVHPRQHHKTIIAIQKSDANSIDFEGQTFCQFYTEIPIASLNQSDNLLTISLSDANLFFEDGSQLPVTAASQTVDWTTGEVVSLPIEGLEFDVHAKDNMTYLNWTTATEIDNSHFNIQHSTNGKDWTILGKVQGAGNSTTVQHYDWLHQQPNIGQNFYRLEQFDFNGASTFSTIEVVEIKGEQSIITYQNPIKEELYLKINAPQEEESIFALYNNNGQLIEQRHVNLHQGTQTLTWQMEHLPQGLYLLKIIGDTTEVLKIVKD